MPRLPDLGSQPPAYPSNRAYSSSIRLSSSFLKSGAGLRSAWPAALSARLPIPQTRATH
jgi:hypothetical protein